MNAAKAYVGGTVAAFGDVIGYLLHQIPFVMAMPPDIQAAVEFLVIGAIGWVAVYFIPNRGT